MSLPKVLIDPRFRRMEGVYPPQTRARLEACCELLWARDEPAPDDFVATHAHQIEAILCGYWAYGDVSRFPKLKAIIETGGNLPAPDKLDYAHCFAQGIRVLSCSTAFGPYVAELGLTLAISAARNIGLTDRAMHSDGSENWSHTELGDSFSLYGKPIGLIGYGGLARSLRQLLAPFQPKLMVHDPWLTDSYLESQGVQPVSVETLLTESRVIFVLAAPSADNKAFLDRERLELIRTDAVFVLLSRAHVVDFDALTRLVGAGWFRAGIDVYPEEPLPADHPIRKADKAVLTSHRAGTTEEAIAAIGEVAVDDLAAILSGRIPMRCQAAQPEYLKRRG
ncbi:MAG: NAD(P)-dependent oxidoreductase [Armatimonas sp.]